MNSESNGRRPGETKRADDYGQHSYLYEGSDSLSGDVSDVGKYSVFQEEGLIFLFVYLLFYFPLLRIICLLQVMDTRKKV